MLIRLEFIYFILFYSDQHWLWRKKKKEKRSQRHFKRIRNSPLEEVELPIPYGDDILTEKKKIFFLNIELVNF